MSHMSNHNPLPIIDGEAAPYPRPRTLAQEVEVQRRRCKCVCESRGNHYAQQAVVREWRGGLKAAMGCGGCRASAHGSTPLEARIRFNKITRKSSKATRAFDALKARLKAANEKLQWAENAARRNARLLQLSGEYIHKQRDKYDARIEELEAEVERLDTLRHDNLPDPY